MADTVIEALPGLDHGIGHLVEITPQKLSDSASIATPVWSLFSFPLYADILRLEDCMFRGLCAIRGKLCAHC